MIRNHDGRKTKLIFKGRGGAGRGGAGFGVFLENLWNHQSDFLNRVHVVDERFLGVKASIFNFKTFLQDVGCVQNINCKTFGQ